MLFGINELVQLLPLFEGFHSFFISMKVNLDLKCKYLKFLSDLLLM